MKVIKRKHFFFVGEPGNVYFRLFGYGLAFKDTRRHRLYFSERMGLRKQLRVGPWLIEALGRE